MDVLTIKPESAGQTLASSLANRLKQQITSGSIAPGEKLRLDDLRASFGVSSVSYTHLTLPTILLV